MVEIELENGRELTNLKNSKWRSMNISNLYTWKVCHSLSQHGTKCPITSLPSLRMRTMPI
jgi:hypothetical protein